MNGFLFLLVGVLLPQAVWAWPPYYGPEFTFTNSKIIDSHRGVVGTETDVSVAKQQDFLNVLRDRCKRRGDCYVSKEAVLYKDGWWFDVTTDPDVIEVRAKRMTLEDVRRLKGRIQEDIFDVAKSLDIIPNPHLGGGHIHVDAPSALEGDVKNLRNIMVDFANHPELATGVLYDRASMSPPFSALPLDKKNAFNRIISEVDSGSVTTPEEFALRIQRDVFQRSMGNGGKYQAVSLKRIHPNLDPIEHTIEIRSIRAQVSAEEFLRQVELFETRFKYLRNLKKPVPFLNRATPERMQEKIDLFHGYVTEAGLDWDRYATLLPPSWRGLTQSCLIQGLGLAN